MSDEDRAVPREQAIRLALDTLEHRVRFDALLACAAKPTAPSQIEYGKSVGAVAHHFKTLHKQKYLRVHHKEARRGATMTFYAATTKGQKLLRRMGIEDASA